MTTEGTVTITEDEYSELIEDSQFLAALRAAGVDNWNGYDHAIDIVSEWIQKMTKKNTQVNTGGEES